ncbi:63463535-adc3-4781-85b9-76beb7b35cd5 [Thermothielavioides terrestris]|uniref:protein-tyrosine-phosphatase n=1 Tax=Thermothielavioides terrestris TaxID=2587410 RepID=A0A446BDT2_9PEZI|nr:63463535-adc3-4781-85b9-76beb7b35cd5 [Thermothielavioides terrestris]
MPPEQRASDRPCYYTMRTPGPVPAVSPQGLAAHSRSSPQTYVHSSKATTSPVASPRLPHPAKLSPGASRGAAHDPQMPSPNYFGLDIEPTTDPRDSCQLPRENWSPPTSSVKSFAAVLSKQLPLDANPEFEAFRRQADVNRARAAFSLSTSHFGGAAGGVHATSASTASAAPQRPRPPKWHTHGGDGSDFPSPRPPPLAPLAPGSSGLQDVADSRAVRDADRLLQEDSAYISADSKRSSTVSLNPPSILSMPRQDVAPRNSPSPFPPPDREGADSAAARVAGRPCPPSRSGSNSPSPISPQQPLAAAAPQSPGAAGPSMISPAGLRELLEGDQGANVLLLDLRVSPQYMQARIRGALNLCIPTTLLKRPAFNLQKLQQTFQLDLDQEKFANWRSATHIVVYGASSADQRDAVSAHNMIKKFTNEGYSGPASILHGGFDAFAASYPSLVDSSSSGPSPALSLGARSVSSGLRPDLPPVFGGVLLPSANDNPSPFYNNIRQNQDLVDGVGQMAIGVPPGLARDSLPRWLREAVEAGDQGKKVSDRFLRIELAEQSRMREAYSVGSSTLAGKTAEEATARVQLSGIEKGGKNRYKDILPFEHARVRLLGRPEGACDYVNASHVRSRRTNKRYIASQGPLPATFEDFWSVVWDNDVRIIVMLTAESEGGQLKCHPYWKGGDFGPLKLRVLSEKKVSLDMDRRPSPPSTAADGPMSSLAQTSATDPFLHEAPRRRANTATTLGSGASMPNPFNFASQVAGAPDPPFAIIRKFALSHAAHPFSPIREITQLHYPSWPDFGAPAQPSHLLALVELANVMQRAALPVVEPGSLHLASTSCHNSGPSGDGTGSLSTRRQGVHSSSSSPGQKRADGSSVLPSWIDGPEQSEHARPMLVHCSAGCGRTGAFCTVDSVIDMLKRQRQHLLSRSRNGSAGSATGENSSDGKGNGDVVMGDEGTATVGGAGVARHRDGGNPCEAKLNADIDTSWLDNDDIDLIAQTVEEFRGQRLSMVQSLRQFVLCYETVLEWIRRLQESGAGGIDMRGRTRSGSLAL